MDDQTLLAAREFAAYDYLFEHVLQAQEGAETENAATSAERLSLGIGREKSLELHALFAEAAIRSGLQEADVQRLLSSKESFRSEMEGLLRRFAGK